MLTSPDFILTRVPPSSGTLPGEQLGALYVGAFQAIAGSPALSPSPPAPAPTATRSTSSRGASSAKESSKASSSKSAAKPATTGPTSEDIAFECRKHALMILARSPTLERDVDLFWDQATKWGAIYVKNSSCELLLCCFLTCLVTALCSFLAPCHRATNRQDAIDIFL